MLRPMEIPVGVGQIDRATQAMAELARQTRETGAAARSIRMSAASAPGGAMSIRRAGAIQAAATSAQAMQVRARAALTTAQVRADTQAMRAQAAQAVAARQLNRALSPVAGRAPATPEQRIAQAVLSSRFSAQGIQPLVGRTLAAAGIQGPEAAKLGIAFGAISLAAAAVERFGKFVAEASERVHQFGIATTISGGTGAQVARLRGMGVPVGEIAGASGSLRERLGASPMAQAVGAQLGIGPVLPISVGSQNNAAILQAALEALRKVTDGEEQLRKARILGLDTMLDQIRVSDDVWNRGKALAAVNATIYDAKMLQSARDLAGETRNLENAWDSLRGQIAKPWIGPLTTGIKAATDAISGKRYPAASAKKPDWVPKFLWDYNQWGNKMLGRKDAPLGTGSDPDPGITAQQRNTDALDRLAAELMRLNQNMGGGPRANSAFPANYFSGTGAMYGDSGFKRYAEEERRALEEHARRLGPGAG